MQKPNIRDLIIYAGLELNIVSVDITKTWSVKTDASAEDILFWVTSKYMNGPSFKLAYSLCKEIENGIN